MCYIALLSGFKDVQGVDLRVLVVQYLLRAFKYKANMYIFTSCCDQFCPIVVPLASIVLCMY